MQKSVIGVLAITLAGCSPQQRPEPVRIERGVYEPYEAEQFPRLYATWGAGVVNDRLQRLREKAAEKVALHPDCDAVMISDVSDRTAPPAAPRVFVDCENGNRWRLTEADLARPLPPGQNVYNPG